MATESIPSIIARELGIHTDQVARTVDLLDDEPRTASVVPTEDTECLVLSQWEFFGALREDAEMGIAILQEVAKRFRRALNVL